MSAYKEQVEMTHEQEGSYSRRDYREPSSKPTTTSTSYNTEKHLVPVRTNSKPKHGKQDLAARYSSDDEDKDNYEEWTTSKRKINHTTRQVETRVSRQLLVEDGKVIADSGPQVTTRIKEDNKVEECEKEKAPKNRKAFEALEGAPERASADGRVLGEKKEIQRVSHEVREENMQYHDERFKELTGRDVHRRAIKAPHELMSIHDEHDRHSKGPPRGKVVHYSNKGKKYQDTDEILEVAKLAIDGSVTKEVKRTRHHEEFSEDEKPDEKGEAEALRRKPIVERSSRRHVDYVNDFDDTATPESSDTDAREPRVRQKSSGKLSSARRRDRSDEAFPRYQIDPLLNSLREEDFKPVVPTASRGHRVEHSSPVVVRQRATSSSSSSSSSDADEHRAHHNHYHQRHYSPSHRAEPASAVEIPEEYRANKQRLMSGKSSSGRRSQSPSVARQVVHKSRGARVQPTSTSLSRREDASVQARLTDEEEELNAHEKSARYLERQSTPNSSRHYYYGESKHKNGPQKRKDSVSSLSSSSSVDSIEHAKLRKSGAISRDSGFRSPAQRAQTPSSQIYSVSSKSKQHRGNTPASPTPSVGQRSVRTKTTTMSAGLKERPLSPEHMDDDECPARPERNPKRSPNTRQQHEQQRNKSGAKVSRTPSPFQKLAHFFKPKTNKQMAAAR